MCFFDVSSLFTNLPLDETIQMCLDNTLLTSWCANTTPPSLKRFAWVLHKKSHFIFDGQYYDQIINDVTMGSPLGPVLANIFTCHFEEKWVLGNDTRGLLFGSYMLTILSPCSTTTTQQISFYIFSIVVIRMSNLLLNLRRTTRSLS